MERKERKEKGTVVEEFIALFSTSVQLFFSLFSLWKGGNPCTMVVQGKLVCPTRRTPMDTLDEVNLTQFWHFSNEKFCLEFWAQRVRDQRKRKRLPIPSATIFLSVVLMGVLGVASFLGLDGILRRRSAKQLLRSNRKMVASDSTVARVVKQMEIGRDMLQTMCYSVRAQGWGKVELPRAGRVRIGVIDGSSFGKLLASVFQCLGAVAVPLDLEPYEKYGKELPASYTLLKRVAAQHGKGFVDYIGGDGLYLTHEFFRLCREEMSCHGFIKTDEETSTLRQDADGLFDASPPLPGVEYVEGVDEQRYLSYRIWASGDFQWDDLPFPLKIARVEETFLKGKEAGKTVRFYVITTDESLTALDLRQLGHLRWGIENNGFKGLNGQCHSKHRFFRKDTSAMAKLILILFVSYILVQASLCWVKQHAVKWNLEDLPRELFLPWLRQILWESLGLIAYQRPP